MPGAVSDEGNDLSRLALLPAVAVGAYGYYACQFTDLAANAVQSMLVLVIHQAPTWVKGVHRSNPPARASKGAHIPSVNSNKNIIAIAITIITIAAA